MNKLEIWTPEEAGLLYEMKSRCLNGGNYKDEKAKEKFKMLCHLEDYCIEFYEGEKEIERLNNIIDELHILFIEFDRNVMRRKYVDANMINLKIKEKLKELKGEIKNDELKQEN